MGGGRNIAKIVRNFSSFHADCTYLHLITHRPHIYQHGSHTVGSTIVTGLLDVDLEVQCERPQRGGHRRGRQDPHGLIHGVRKN